MGVERHDVCGCSRGRERSGRTCQRPTYTPPCCHLWTKSILRGCQLRLWKRGVRRPLPRVVMLSLVFKEVTRRGRFVCRRTRSSSIKARDSRSLLYDDVGRVLWTGSTAAGQRSIATFETVSEVWLVTTCSLVCLVLVPQGSGKPVPLGATVPHSPR